MSKHEAGFEFPGAPGDAPLPQPEIKVRQVVKNITKIDTDFKDPPIIMPSLWEQQIEAVIKIYGIAKESDFV